MMIRCRIVLVAGALVHLVLGGPLGAVHPQSASAYMASGDKKFQSRDLAGAIDDYTKAIALDPSNVGAFTSRGFIRIQADHLDGALADFTQAIALAPKDAANFGLRGYVKNAKGDLDGAISDARQAIVLNPRALLAYQTMAEVHFFKAFRCAALTEAQKRENVSLGLDAADRAFQLDADDYNAPFYKSLLLRTQAGLETDPAKQKSLVQEADALRARSDQIRASGSRTVSPLPPIPPDRPLNCGAGAPTSPTRTPPPPPPPPALRLGSTPQRPTPPPGAVRAGVDVPTPKQVKDVPPVYPPIAKAARIQGAVIVEVTIGRDGKVMDAFILKSAQFFDQAALDAVRQWEFEPAVRNGVAVPVIATFTVTFRLQ